MKKTLVTLLATAAFAALAAGTVFAAGTAGSGIYQTPHDINFKMPASRDAQDRLCAFCHTPHHAYTANDPAPVGPVLAASGYSPLWSHGVSTQNFVAYQSPRFDTLGGLSMANDPLIGPSRLCMSCHDGSVAVDTYYGINTASTNFISNGANTNFGMMPLIEADGHKSHPIGFDATTVVTGATVDSHIWPGMLTNTYRGNANAVTVQDRLYQGQYFTCSTCHDVHNKLNETAASIPVGTQHYFLLGGQTNSAICITCHNQAETTYGSVPVANGSPL